MLTSPSMAGTTREGSLVGSSLHDGLLDGLYLDNTTGVTLTAGLDLTASAVAVQVSGGIHGEVKINRNASQPRIYYDQIFDGNASNYVGLAFTGDIYAEASISVGVFYGPISVTLFSYELLHKDLITFGDTVNLFQTSLLLRPRMPSCFTRTATGKRSLSACIGKMNRCLGGRRTGGLSILVILIITDMK